MSANNELVILKNVHTARGEFYAFLSKAFSNSPNAELYQMLADMTPKLKALMEYTDNEEIKTGINGFFAFIEKRNSFLATELKAFDLERSQHYTSLFCLPKSIPVDESVYTSPEHQPRGDSLDKVIELFIKYRMFKAENIHENEDFVSYEFLFMSKLAYDCADFIEEGKTENYKAYLQAQYDFHINHFDKWIYQFFARVVQSGVEDEILYKYLAHLGAGFINEDKLTLSELLSQ